MDLTHEFRVDVPVPEAWKVLTDVERIAPMMPGAQLQEVEGDEYRGVVKVKVGPITAQYKGTATFVERDEAAGKVVLKASGRDTRGQGNATAVITATMKPDGDGTRVSVVTDLTVTGKVAQFGRGVMADVSSKLLGQFVDALEADMSSSGRGPARRGTETATLRATGPFHPLSPEPSKAPTVRPRPALDLTRPNRPARGASIRPKPSRSISWPWLDPRRRSVCCPWSAFWSCF